MMVDEESPVVEQASADASPANSADEARRADNRTFILTLSSNLLFTTAAALYLWMSILDINWQKQVEAYSNSDGSLGDDYWTSWGASTNNDDAWLNYYNYGDGLQQYKIVHAVAAGLFIVTGILDCINYPGILGVFWILAGALGLASALLMDSNPRVSSILNVVSINTLLLEALGLLFCHGRRSGRNESGSKGIHAWLRVADGLFVAGTVLECVLSYFYLFQDFSLTLARLGVVSSCLWLACCTIYVTTTILLHRNMKRSS